FTAYGITHIEQTPELSRQILVWTVLHKYGSLTMIEEFADARPPEMSAEALAARLWPLGTYR
ncbi:MAG: hypothetical protein AAFX99_02765, partial [Myxococcota bacterium]